MKKRQESARIALDRQAAKRGDAEACYLLGQYYEGFDLFFEPPVKPNARLACRWYLTAARKGHAGAQCALGFHYAAGCCVKRDLRQALGWYRKAARQGEYMALHSLGHCYNDGTGVRRDPEKAIHYFCLAFGMTRKKLKVQSKTLGIDVPELMR